MNIFIICKFILCGSVYSRFINILWGKDEEPVNNLENLDIYDIENDDIVYSMIDDKWAVP